MNAVAKTKGAGVWRREASNVSCCEEVPNGEGRRSLSGSQEGEPHEPFSSSTGVISYY